MNGTGKEFSISARFSCQALALALVLALPAAGQYTITTIAGGNPTDVAATSVDIAAFSVAVVSLPSPATYILSYDNRVYKVDANSVLSVVAGTGAQGYSGDNGPATEAQLDTFIVSTPSGITADTSGNVYFVDGNYSPFVVPGSSPRIRAVTADGVISTLYTSTASYIDAIAADGMGSLYVVEGSNDYVEQFDAATGNLVAVFFSSGPVSALAVDSAGDLYAIVSDLFVEKLVGTTFTTIAGNGTFTYVEGAGATSTGFTDLNGLTVVNSGASAVIYAGDGEYIRKIAGGTVTTVAGNSSGVSSGDGGPAVQAGFADLQGISSDSSGSLYMADPLAMSVRKIWASGGLAGDITTIAGGGAGDGGAAISAALSQPSAIAVNATSGAVYLISDVSSRVREVSKGVITTAAGTLTAGFTGDGSATANELKDPSSIAVDSTGNLYISDAGNCRIRKVTPSGSMTTIAGNGSCTYTGDGPALQTGLDPLKTGVDGGGNVYVLDNSGLVRKIQGNTISTLSLPTGPAGYEGFVVDRLGDFYMGNLATGTIIKIAGDDVIQIASGFTNPVPLAVDSAGNVYVASMDQIWKVTQQGFTVTTIGDGAAGFSGDGGPADAAELDDPISVAVDNAGNVYIADFYNNRIRMAIPEPTSPPVVSSISPASAYVGTQAFTLTVNGTGFKSGAAVLWNGSPLPTTFISSTQLKATLSAALLTSAGTAIISVESSAGQSFSVLAPVISYIEPLTGSIPNSQFTLTVTGAGFIQNVSTVHFNGQALATTFVNAGELTAVVPANQSTSPVPVSVFNLSTSSNETIYTPVSPGQYQYNCQNQPGPATLMRALGEAELFDTLTIACSPLGSSGIISTNIDVFTSVPFTSRILDAATYATEALLLVNGPPWVLGQNAFQGFLAGGNEMSFPGVLLDLSSSSTLSVVNLRVNASTLAVGESVGEYASVSAYIETIQSATNPQPLGYALPTDFQAATVYSANDLRSLQLGFKELWGDAFKARVLPGGVQDNGEPLGDLGFYGTESGFVDPSLLPGAGLADSGTRLLVQLSNIPAGVKAYAAVSSQSTTDVTASLVSTDSFGVGPEGVFIPGSSMFGGTYAPIGITDGVGTAVWEIVNGDPFVTASLGFNIVLTGVTQPGLGGIIVEGSLAPISTDTLASATAPLPRFVPYFTGFVNLTLSSTSAATSSSNSGGGSASAAVHVKTAAKSVAAAGGADAPSAPIQAGSTVTLQYSVLNNSPGPVTQVTLSSKVSSQLSVASCNATGISCTTNSDGSTTVTAVTSGSLQPGAVSTISFSATACNPAVNSNCSAGTVATTVSALNANQQYVESDNDNTSLSTSFSVVSSSSAPQVNVQLASNPSNLLLQIGASTPSANPAATVPQNGSLSFQAITPQPGANGTEYVFDHWSDGSKSAIRTNVPAPIGGGTFTANFVTGYPLNVTPTTGGGTVTLNPPGGYYPQNAVVEITATPATGAKFLGFTGSLSGSSPALQVVMQQSALYIEANFTDIPQTITFNPVANQVLGSSPFSLSATASSGLPVTFSSNSTAVCTVAGSVVTLVAAGTCSITARQPGTQAYDAYEPAVAVTRTFKVGIAQTISFGALSASAIGTGIVTLTATASSGQTVTYVSNNTKVCTVSGAKVTLLEIGTCSITASQAGNADYLPATPVTQTFSVLGEAQTINFPDPATAHLSAKTAALTATASSKLTVNYTSNSQNFCTVSGAKVTLLAPGSCSITANQAGNAVYAAANPVTQTFTIESP